MIWLVIIGTGFDLVTLVPPPITPPVLPGSRNGIAV